MASVMETPADSTAPAAAETKSVNKKVKEKSKNSPSPNLKKNYNRCKEKPKQFQPRLTLEKQNIFNAIEQEQNNLSDIGHDVWRLAEAPSRELQSHKRITEYLQNKGFSFSELGAHYHTAFRAYYGPEDDDDRLTNPNIAFLCEYGGDNAHSHPHGHNLNTTATLAAAIGLQRAINFSKKPIGTVTVIGCPQNATKTLKKEMYEFGYFEDVDIVICGYPANFTCLNPIFVASKRMQVRFKGRGPDDGYHKPWEMANPVNAVVMSQQGMAALRGIFQPGWLITGVIPNAGKDPCSVPKSAACIFEMRAAEQKGIDIMKEKLHNCIEGAATASGCQFTETEEGVSFIPNKSCSKFIKPYRKNAELNGFTFHNEDENERQRGPDDIAFISQHIPVFKFYYYAGTAADLGSDEFNRFAGSEEAEYMNFVQGKSLAMMAVDLLLQKALLDEIKEDHSGQQKGSGSQTLFM